MIEKFASLEFTNADIPRRLIGQHVKGLIVSGELPPGSTIPSTRALAALWKTHIPTVHAALIDLLREGLIIRRHGKGTFVAEQIAYLRDAAIYCSLESMNDPMRWFQRSLVVGTRNTLHEIGVNAAIWMDQRPLKECSTTWPELEYAARNRDVQGLFALTTEAERTRWLLSLPVPTATLSPTSPSGVKGDIRQMFSVVFENLKQRKIRSLGFISPRSAGDWPRVLKGADVFRYLSELGKEYDIQIQRQWIRIPEGGLDISDMPEFGHRQFGALWDLRSRPEALFVEPDVVVEGVLATILQRGVEVPKDLVLVLHRNETHRYFCPMDATFVISSEQDFCHALVYQVRRQLAGEKCRPITIPYKLAEHKFARSK
ncbi:MAG: GntR family transcriptional regulator [Chthoniobacterales bacterium]|nr:GntR family transcriptional regulator [Chthoniobacterales bacterium]